MRTCVYVYMYVCVHTRAGKLTSTKLHLMSIYCTACLFECVSQSSCPLISFICPFIHCLPTHSFFNPELILLFLPFHFLLFPTLYHSLNCFTVPFISYYCARAQIISTTFTQVFYYQSLFTVLLIIKTLISALNSWE